MTAKNNIPVGYKDSAVGIIPHEWKVKQLALLGKIFSGGTPSTDKEEYWGGNIMWCTPSDITSISSKYINNTKDRITAMGLKNSSAILLPINSIIVCTRATIGAAAITQVELSTNQGFKNIKPEKCNTEWLYYSMILNQPKLQRLLTGRTRLPGFTTPWQKRRMKDCFEHITDTSNGCKYLPMTISARLGLISQKDKFDRVIAGDSLKKYTHIQKGDFAYNKGNSNLYEMGCIYRSKEQDAVVPFVYICFRPKQNVIGEFYQHFFINHGLDRQLKRIITSGARGDGLLNVDKTDFFELEIVYPHIAEQKAIAEVLTVADKEIATHRKKLDALRLQKHGLMQQLLTGKTRVKI